MSTKKFMNNKGVTTGDIVISIIIIIIFVTIITNSFYNYYISVQYKKRKTVAVNAVIDIIEGVEAMKYSEVNENSVKTLANAKVTDKGYTVTTTVTQYNQTTGNTNKQDVIKILNVKIEYMVNKKTEVFEVKRLITKGDFNES